MAIPVIIDTDIGDDIDDVLALALALRSPELELVGITTVFQCAELRTRLALPFAHKPDAANSIGGFGYLRNANRVLRLS